MSRKRFWICKLISTVNGVLFSSLHSPFSYSILGAYYHSPRCTKISVQTFKVFIYYFERQRDSHRQPHSGVISHSLMQSPNDDSQASTGSQELSPYLPSGWQGPEYWSHHLPPRVFGSRWNPGTPI